MSLTPDAMAYLADLGLSLEQVIEAARLNGAQGKESADDRRRRLDRERKRALKSAENSAESAESPAQTVPQNLRNSAEIPAENGPPHVRVLDKPLTKVLTGSDDDEDTRARSSSEDWPKVRDLGKHLAEHIESPWLDPSKEPGLALTATRFAMWRRAGASWEHDVLPVVGAVCRKAKGPISTWSYFDKAIAQSIADNRAALEIPAARATGPPGGSFVDRLTADNNEARRRVLSG